MPSCAHRPLRLLLLLLPSLCATFLTSAAQRAPLSCARASATAPGGCSHRAGNYFVANQPQLQQQLTIIGGASAMRWARGGARRAAPARCGLLQDLADNSSDDGPPLKAGQQVRVIEEAMMMHVPGKKEGFDAKGSVGTVLRTYSEKNLSPNRGIKVEFQEPKKWVAHFERWELELVE